MLWATQSSARFLFFCSGMMGICQDQPVQLVWSGRAIPQNRPPLYTNLKKLMWTGLQSVHPQSYDMINRMSRDTASQSAMVTEVAAGRRAGASEAAIFGHVACKWIKANAATWIKWIPRVCPSGQAFLRDTGTCTPCPVGTASPDGKSCVACSDGDRLHTGSSTGHKRLQSCLGIVQLDEVGYELVHGAASAPRHVRQQFRLHQLFRQHNDP